MSDTQTESFPIETIPPTPRPLTVLTRNFLKKDKPNAKYIICSLDGEGNDMKEVSSVRLINAEAKRTYHVPTALHQKLKTFGCGMVFIGTFDPIAHRKPFKQEIEFNGLGFSFVVGHHNVTKVKALHASAKGLFVKE